MSTLNALLQWKQNQDAIQQNNAASISRAVDTFNQLRQQGIQNKMAMLQTKVGAAQSGIAIGEDGRLSYDPSLLNPLSQIMAASKLQADASQAGNSQVYGMAGDAINRMLGNSQPSSAVPGGFQTSQGVIPVGGSPVASPVASPVVSPVAAQSGGLTPMSASTKSGMSTIESKNIPAEAQAAATTKKATDLAGAQSDAEVSQSRDVAQMGLIAQSMKNMLNIHKELSDKGFAGNVYGPGVISNLNMIPSTSLQNKLVPPDVQNLAGKFTSARNEAVQKVIPMLSQQFGKEGSSRIMDSLLDLAKGELGDLSTPHTQMEGQAEGTLGSLYRIKMAGDKYLADLKSQGQSIPSDEKSVTEGIYSKMGDLTPEQNNQLQAMTKNVLGNSKTQNSFSSEADAIKANLPKGTVITINGRRARID